MVSRTTPLLNQPVAAPGLTRWLGGVDPLPGTELVEGIDETARTFTPGTMVGMHPGDGAPKGALVTIEIVVPAAAGTDLLWFCLGTTIGEGETAHTQGRAWPIAAGERFEHNAHMQGITSFSLRATASDGTSNPSAAITPRIKAGWDRRG